MTSRSFLGSARGVLHGIAIVVLLIGLASDAFLPAPARAEGPNAILNLSGCTSNSLARGDDSISQQAQLGFTMNFFGTNYTSVYVNTNGNVTFTGPLAAYVPFDLSTTNTPIIAAYFDDIDTRNAQSGQVQFGTTQYGGRNAFCVNWVNVGQYNTRADQLNSFQLLLVDRADTGGGNFDLYLNYDKIQFNQRNAGVGYAKGNPSDNSTFFQFPGSRQAGAFIDSNTSTGLIRGSRGTTQLGRYVFEVRSGAVPVGGRLIGKLTNVSNAALADAPVQACPNLPGTRCVITRTNSTGDYSLSGLPAGNGYIVTGFAPSGSNLVNNIQGPITITANQTTTQNITLLAPLPTPAGTSVTGPGVIGNTNGVPSVFRGQPFDITTTGTAGCSVSYQIILNGSVISSGSMTESPAGTYKATVTLPPGLHGMGEIKFTRICNNTTTTTSGGGIYIDPSGFVRTTAGTPVVGATVTLFRSDNSAGPFTQVPNGDAIMSPTNRRNPDTTDSVGHFGWDVVAGYYKVRAEKAGCTSPSNPAQAFAETDVLTIPPPVFDLDIRLNCGTSAPPPTPCSPRPRVAVTTSQPSTGRLQVSVSAGNGALRELRFNIDPVRVPRPNAVIQISEGTINGSTVTLPDNITSTTFFVNRVAGGPTTVPFIAVDGCGDWPTFVGFGADR